MIMARRKDSRALSGRGTVENAGGQYDWWLFAIVLMLLCIGILMVLSASGVVAERLNGDKYYFFKRQVLYACVGGAAMWIAAAMPRELLYRLQYPFLIGVIMLLLITLSPLERASTGRNAGFS